MNCLWCDNRAMERLDNAERVIRDTPTRTEWAGFAKYLLVTRTILDGSTPNEGPLIEWTREWAEALGAPECMEAIKSIGTGAAP